jgi:nucleotidyltransferase/DNA polymerase involved in DNA repair
MPKGYRLPKTLDKLAARELVRQKVTEHLAPLLEAQIKHAVGLRYLVARDKTTGKFTKLTEEQAEKLLADGGEDSDRVVVEVWEKDPSVQAFTDLLNRALDKPKEQEIDVNLRGAEAVVERLQAARRRVGK